MLDPNLDRFLTMLCQKLGAADARVEVGGRQPDAAHLVWHSVAGTRIVAVFDDAQAAPPDAQERLAALCAGFGDTISRTHQYVISRAAKAFDARALLEDELTGLAVRAGAQRATVIDLNSPVIWGTSSLPEEPAQNADEVLEEWVDELRERHESELRQSHGHVIRLTVRQSHECLAKLFNGIYVVSLYFERPLSEPVAVGALLHAMNTIERLVLALPPVDPPPPGGQVIRLARRLRR